MGTALGGIDPAHRDAAAAVCRVIDSVRYTLQRIYPSPTPVFRERSCVVHRPFRSGTSTIAGTLPDVGDGRRVICPLWLYQPQCEMKLKGSRLLGQDSNPRALAFYAVLAKIEDWQNNWLNGSRRRACQKVAKNLTAILWIQLKITRSSRWGQNQLILNEGSLTASGTPRNREHRSARHCSHSALCKPPRYEKQDGRKMLDPLQLCAGTA